MSDASKKAATDDMQDLSTAFNSALGQARKELDDFRPTLTSLHRLINHLQNSLGLQQVGIELATFDVLRQLNLIRQSDDAAGHGRAVFCILSVDDARYLIRVHPGNVVDCSDENLNRATAAPRCLDSEEFWYRKAKDGKTQEPKFYQYNLTEETDRQFFLQAVVQAAAVTAAMRELRSYDMPVRTATPLSKPSAGDQSAPGL